MKQYRRVPFDIELAKKITSGEVEGSIVTLMGFSVRIICFDKRTSSGYSIIALIDYPDHSELCANYNDKGKPGNRVAEYALHIELLEEVSDHKYVYEFSENPSKLLHTEQINNIATKIIVDGTVMKSREGIMNRVTFKPFDKVLIRENPAHVWHCDLYSYTDNVHGIHYCIGHSGSEIIPYEGNEHLVGTTNNAFAKYGKF